MQRFACSSSFSPFSPGADLPKPTVRNDSPPSLTARSLHKVPRSAPTHSIDPSPAPSLTPRVPNPVPMTHPTPPPSPGDGLSEAPSAPAQPAGDQATFVARPQPHDAPPQAFAPQAPVGPAPAPQGFAPPAYAPQPGAPPMGAPQPGAPHGGMLAQPGVPTAPQSYAPPHGQPPMAAPQQPNMQPPGAQQYAAPQQPAYQAPAPQSPAFGQAQGFAAPAAQPFAAPPPVEAAPPPAAPAMETPAPPAAAAPAPAADKRRILVVEDNNDTRMLLERILRRTYDVTAVGDARSALVAMHNARFDGLVLDINLGGKETGADILRIARSLDGYAGVFAIALTAYALPGDRERLLEKGFSEYISKPFTRSALMDSLARGVGVDA